MTSETPRTGEKFCFRSFSAHRHPLQPRGRIEFSQAQALSTYYLASYDAHGRLIEFSKMIREADGGEGEWQVAFTEAYRYFENGTLLRRTLKIPGHADKSWSFEDQRSWSDYFERLCSAWFRSASPADHPSTAQAALLVHEQFTEVELTTFEASIGVARDDVWAVNATMRMLSGTRDILRQVDSIADPRISAIAITQDKSQGLVLNGFDEPAPNLFGVIDSWRDDHPDADEVQTVMLLAERDLDDSGRHWARESQIGSITFAPIRIAEGGELVAVAILVLTTERRVNEDSSCVLTSVFRRVLAHYQLILDLKRSYQSSEMGL